MNFSPLVIFALLFAIVTSTVVVNQLTDISHNNLVYSGSISLTGSQSSLFFTYYGKNGQMSQANLKNYPLLIFIGSPGTSAQYASLTSMGPLKLNNDLTLSANPNSPNEFANTMFLDLLGSGFSFAKDLNQVPSRYDDFGNQLTQVLNTFIKQSQLGKSQDFYIVEEGTGIRILAGMDQIDPIKAIFHISSWSEIYAMGRYAGLAGLELKLISTSDKLTIDTTFISCSNLLRAEKYLQARKCYESILNFLQTKTKNTNLFNVRLYSNLTDAIPLIQYYFTQSGTVSKFKAPNSALFESQSNLVQNRTYIDQAKNYTRAISLYTKDNLSVKHVFLASDSDLICYYRAIRNWLENELSFVESVSFKAKSLDDLKLDGQTVGYIKSVKQVAYIEMLNSGHYLLSDQNNYAKRIIKAVVTETDPTSNIFNRGRTKSINIVEEQI